MEPTKPKSTPRSPSRFHKSNSSPHLETRGTISPIPSFFGNRRSNYSIFSDPFSLDVPEFAPFPQPFPQPFFRPFPQPFPLTFPQPFPLTFPQPFPQPFPLTFPRLSRENSASVSTRGDWKETPEAYVFKAVLPGLKKEEVKVEIEDGRVLQISGKRNVEKEKKNDTRHRVERSSGEFMRRFRLAEDAKMDEGKAAMENGVLTVTVPKVKVKKPDVKAI